MKKQWVQLLCGVSGSGKSTHSQELKRLLPSVMEINRDEWCFDFYTNGVHDWSLYKFTKDRENRVTAKCNELFDIAVQAMRPIVISNTNLNQKDHDYWKVKAEEAGYDFEVVYFPITLEEALYRDSKRGALAVGREVLFKQWQKWLKISGFKKYVPDTSKHKAIIVDIDGTVAMVNGRSHYDYTKVSTDLPRKEIIKIVQCWAMSSNAEIIFMSGREDSCRADTVRWLHKHFEDTIPYLYMRKTGDQRNDRIVKEELFREYVADNWNVIGAVDDRPRVVRLWNDLGIENVISVSVNYLEF